MHDLSLAQIIHQERQAEIERTLRTRRLLERPAAAPRIATAAAPTRAGSAQTPAGATS